MGAALSFLVTFEHAGACPTCGVEVILPSNRQRILREEGGTFYCCNGHEQSYKRTEVQRLQAELEKALRMKEDELARRKSAEADMERAQRSAAAYRGKLKHVKEHVGNGVCPCCRRSFQNLQRHMKTKHPGYAREDLP